MTTLPERLALLNACLNGIAGLLLIGGYIAIRRHRVDIHKRLMWRAFIVSVLFLISYLTRISIAGDTPFQGEGIWRPIYFTILITHVVLAMAVPPLALRTLFLGQKERFVQHRKIAKWTLPIWLYVSVTGVIVYLMLYQMNWASTTTLG